MALRSLPAPSPTSRPVVPVVGGGYVGLSTALRLQKKPSRGRLGGAPPRGGADHTETAGNQAATGRAG